MTTSRGGRTPVVLIVLDGWGFRAAREGNAVELGRTPTWHRLWERAPRTLLDASGLPVGLPEGQMGNSEVGHLNLGAGRVVAHLLAAVELGRRAGVPVTIHAWLDGRDTLPKSGLGFMEELLRNVRGAA